MELNKIIVVVEVVIHALKVILSLHTYCTYYILITIMSISILFQLLFGLKM